MTTKTTAPGKNATHPKNRRKTMQYPQSARSAQLSFAHWMSPARWARGSAAVLLTLAAPAISIAGALTIGLHGTSPAVSFPPGYGVSLTATVAATTIAAALAALIARRDALVAIPVSLGIWFVTGLGVIAAGVQLGHTGLTGWGVILIAASLTGAAAGMLVAALRGRAGQHPGPRTPVADQSLPVPLPPARR
jgi:hypothetical protein